MLNSAAVGDEKVLNRALILVDLPARPFMKPGPNPGIGIRPGGVRRKLDPRIEAVPIFRPNDSPSPLV